jgi:hypothetical protein
MFAKITNRKRSAIEFRLIAYIVVGFAVVLFSVSGCKSQPPGGEPMSSNVLGSVTDEIMRTQEDNAELAKLIVYVHEFESNTPTRSQSDAESGFGNMIDEGFQYLAPDQVRGFRFTPYGQDHIRQIADHLRDCSQQFGMQQIINAREQVVVERSESSKLWSSQHRFPVHFNPELDEFRRRMVVRALQTYGIPNADQLVVIAPAFPQGLNGQEAAATYSRAYNANGGGQF